MTARRLLTILALLAALLTAPAGVLGAPGAAASGRVAMAIEPGAYCADAEEIAMLDMLNAYRRENGAGTLVLSVALGAAAKHHAESMAAFNYFDGSHDLHFEGENQDETITWQQNIANHGYPDNTHTSRAENLAAGFETAAETLAQWQDSPSHDAHLLSPKYQAVGIGRAFNPESEYRWYWTVTFGSLVDAAAPACAPAVSADNEAAPPGSQLRIVRSGRNGSSTNSEVAYDGDESTAWYTTKARTPTSGYIWFDLGAIQAVSKIEYLFTDSRGADAFLIQVSDDREEWETIAELGRPKSGRWKALEWGGETRYIRFFFTNPKERGVLGFLAEVRIYA